MTQNSVGRKSFGVVVEITPEQAYNTVISGMECGHVSSFRLVDGSWRRAWEKAEQGKGNAFAHVTIEDRLAEEDGEKGARAKLTDDVIQRGLEVLAKKNPRLYAQIVTDDGDAITGDALLQCAVLGDIIYG